MWLIERFKKIGRRNKKDLPEAQIISAQTDLDCTEPSLSGEPSFVLVKKLVEQLNQMLWGLWVADKKVPLQQIEITDSTIREGIASRAICFESILTCVKVVLSDPDFGLINQVEGVNVKSDLKAWLDFMENGNSGDFSRIKAGLDKYWLVIENERKRKEVRADHGYTYQIPWQLSLFYAVQSYQYALKKRNELKSLLASNHSTVEYFSLVAGNKPIPQMEDALKHSIESEISSIVYGLKEAVERAIECTAILINKKKKLGVRPIQQHLIRHFVPALIEQLGLVDRDGVTTEQNSAVAKDNHG